MIQLKTKLIVADNSGGKLVTCIKSKNKSKIGSIITITVKEIKKKSTKVKKKSIYKAIVLRQKGLVKQNNGFYLNFKNNSIIIIDNNNNPIGTKIFGIIPKKLAKKNNKILSLSSYLI